MRLRLILVFIALSLVAVACGDSSSEEGESSSDSDEIVLAAGEVFYAIDKVDDEGRHFLSPLDTAPEVVELQEAMVARDLPVEVTGTYDDPTLAVMLAFQYSQGLVPDGIVGPQTWAALEDPTPLPENVEALTLVEVATVALDDPAQARQMLADMGLPPPVGSTPVETPSGGEPVENPQGEAALAVIRLGEQHVELYDADDNLLYRFPVSSGKDGLTPVGTFEVYSKSEVATSASNNDIKMRWMTRFNGGIGFHGIPVDTSTGEPLETPLGERPVSAGCIRMADDQAKIVYDILPAGATVIVEA